MSVKLILFQSGQKSSQRGLRISHVPEVQFGTAAELFATNVDLYDGRVLGEELLIWKVRSNHQQHLAIHHRVVAGRESQEASHADIKWVVVLDELFAAHRVYDRCLQLACKLHQLVVSSRAT